MNVLLKENKTQLLNYLKLIESQIKFLVNFNHSNWKLNARHLII
ncbi:MAG: hypothetical protein HF967_00740 [Methanosarcinales archaeon]|nr:hypothetical protein [Methanosarcinales archaeon]